ncbi:MAG: HAD family hydrolase [Chloroflexi bacterium]|nr:HAD family hydrolase [Chloroflexota bacterium]
MNFIAYLAHRTLLRCARRSDELIHLGARERLKSLLRLYVDMIRGIIFDLGNTLMYFDGDWESVSARGANALEQYLMARGYPAPEGFGQAYLETRTQGFARSRQTGVEYTAEQALVDTLMRQGVCNVPAAEIPRAVEKFFEPEELHWVSYPDAIATLEILRERGLKLALLSNATDHAWIERNTRKSQLAGFLDPLLSSAKISFRKPDPRAFQPVSDAWQIPPHEIVMVGDAASFDILGAHRAGMRGVLIEERWAEPLKPHADFADAHLMQPDATIRQLGELPSVIAAWNEVV